MSQAARSYYSEVHKNKVPKEAKKQFVSELASGVLVDSLFVLGGYTSRIASNASRYLVYTLQDRTGSIRALEFDRASFGDIPPVDSVVHVYGSVEGVGKRKYIKVTHIEPTQQYESRDFIAQSLCPLEEMWREFGQRVVSLESKPYRALIHHVFHDDKLYLKFIEAPLADKGILAYRGAALERALKVCSIIDTLCELYPQARKNLLLAAGLLKYVGAAKAYAIDALITQTAQGKNFKLELLSLKIIERSVGRKEDLCGAALAVESLIVEGQENNSLQLEKAIFGQACKLIETADNAHYQDFAQGVVGL